MPIKPHAVVDAARAEARLGDGEAAALRADQVRDRHAYVVEEDLGVPAVIAVGVAEDPHAALTVRPGVSRGHQDHALLDVPGAVGSVLPITMKILQFGFIAPRCRTCGR
jgi:hypothetical protein